MSSPIPRIYKSIIRHTQDVITDIKATTGHQTIEYFSFNARFEENKLPTTTLLGMEDFTFQENGGLWVVRYVLTLSTWQDVNLLDEVEILGVIHDKTGERTKVKLRDEVTSEEVSELYCSAWEMAPGVPTSLRNYKAINVELLRAGE